jgi:ketosteroid isomerase-like protein
MSQSDALEAAGLSE